MECSGSVEECLTRDLGAAGSSLTGITALCPLARHINPNLVLVQPRKTRPFITERLLMGCKESNQTNKPLKYTFCRDAGNVQSKKPFHYCKILWGCTPANCAFCCLLITFANSVNPYQYQQDVGTDLDPN